MIDLITGFHTTTLDIGTGDGTFVYSSAERDPAGFYIGLDANPAAGPAIKPGHASDGAKIQLGSRQYRAGQKIVSERVTSDKRIFEIQLNHPFLAQLLAKGSFVATMSVGRVFGFYYADLAIGPADRKKIEIAMRNCF